jgi:hypothetical protein
VLFRRAFVTLVVAATLAPPVHAQTADQQKALALLRATSPDLDVVWHPGGKHVQTLTGLRDPVVPELELQQAVSAWLPRIAPLLGVAPHQLHLRGASKMADRTTFRYQQYAPATKGQKPLPVLDRALTVGLDAQRQVRVVNGDLVPVAAPMPFRVNADDAQQAADRAVLGPAFVVRSTTPPATAPQQAVVPGNHANVLPVWVVHSGLTPAKVERVVVDGLSGAIIERRLIIQH